MFKGASYSKRHEVLRRRLLLERLDARDRLSDYHSEEYREKGLIAHAERLPGADALLTARKDRGVRIVLASQARPKEMDHFLK